MKPAIVLLSGGLDSTTILTHAIREGYTVHALHLQYGQRHEVEEDAANNVADHFKIPLEVVRFPAYARLADWSSLTGPSALAVGRTLEEMEEDIPLTYVPLRNTLLVTLAAAALESWILQLLEGDNGDKTIPSIVDPSIFVGANALDYAGYPDCRPEFYAAIAETIFLGSKLGAQYEMRINIQAPIILKSKTDIIHYGTSIDAPLRLTWSCYAGNRTPCGTCDACVLRAQGFEELGLLDPAL